MKRNRLQHFCLWVTAHSLVPMNPRTGCRMLLSAVLAWTVVFSAIAAESEVAASRGGNVPAVEMGSFHRFLVDPPWIKYVRFRRSGNQEPAINLPEFGKRFVIPSPWSQYEGALLPNGFFLRHLAHTSLYYEAKRVGERIELVYKPPKPGEEWTIGASLRHWWQLDDGNGVVVIAPREPEPGHSVSNGLEIVARNQRQRLEELRCLGMTELMDAEIEWLDATRFQATSRQHGEIEGGITRWRGDLVEELEYQVVRPVVRRVIMRYTYTAQLRMPPVEMVRTVVEDSGTRSFTNVLDQWEEGLDPQHLQGFTVSDFRRKTEPFQFFMIWSNGIRYKMDRNGALARTVEAPPDYSEFSRSRGFGLMSRTVLMVCVMILLGVLAGIWRVRHKNLQNKNTSKR